MLIAIGLSNTAPGPETASNFSTDRFDGVADASAAETSKALSAGAVLNLINSEKKAVRPTENISLRLSVMLNSGVT